MPALATRGTLVQLKDHADRVLIGKLARCWAIVADFFGVKHARDTYEVGPAGVRMGGYVGGWVRHFKAPTGNPDGSCRDSPPGIGRAGREPYHLNTPGDGIGLSNAPYSVPRPLGGPSTLWCDRGSCRKSFSQLAQEKNYFVTWQNRPT